MNKAYLKYLIIVLLAYLIGAFVVWDFYPGHWDSTTRYMTVVLAMVLSFMNTMYESWFS